MNDAVSDEPKRTIPLGNGVAIAAYNSAEFEINISHVASLAISDVLQQVSDAGLGYADLAIRLTPADLRDEFLRDVLETGPTCIFVELDSGRVTLTMTIALPRNSRSDPQSLDLMIATLAPLMQSHQCEVVESHLTGDDIGNDVIELSVLPSGKLTVAQAAHLQILLNDWLSTQTDSARSIADVVRKGQAYRLIGTSESEYFDAKAKHYDRTNPFGRLDFAQDVAAFANSPSGGALVLGVRTVTKLGRDVIDSVSGCAVDIGAEAAYRAILEQLVVPQVRGLTVHSSVVDEAREVFVVLVPPQPRSSLPFVVKGGHSHNGRYTSTMFSVPIRIGDSNRSMHLSEVQRVLANLSTDTDS
jgi:hypothetical protein